MSHSIECVYKFQFEKNADRNAMHSLIDIKYSCNALLISILYENFNNIPEWPNTNWCALIKWRCSRRAEGRINLLQLPHRTQPAHLCWFGRQEKTYTHTHARNRFYLRCGQTTRTWTLNNNVAHRVFLETTKKRTKTQNNKFNLVSKFTVDASAAADCLQIDMLYITCNAMHEIMVQWIYCSPE